MKKFAKISAMLAAMAFAFAFFGCSDGSSGSGSDDSSEINGGGTSGGNTSGSGTTSGGETSGGETSGSGTTSGDSDTSGGGTSTGGTSGGNENIPEVFVKVPAVSIDGSKSDEWNLKSNVFISGRNLEIKAFLMSDHEVTRGEYKKIMGSDPSIAGAYDKDGKKLTDDDVNNNPVNYVSWYDAIVYCNKRSSKEGLIPCYTIKDSNKKDSTNPDDWGVVPTLSNNTWNKAKCNFEANGYRLPTEAEWEWAARGGNDNTTYAGSNNINYVAWYAGNTNNKGTRVVKTKNPNGYGLYDMSGNVWEWCWDWYGSISSSTPESGVSSGSDRCPRGGSWNNKAYGCTVAYRGDCYPYARFYVYGLRVVRTAED